MYQYIYPKESVIQAQLECETQAIVQCHDSTILFSLFMPTFFFLVYFTLSHMTLLSHGSHVQSHDGSPDLSHDDGT